MSSREEILADFQACTGIEDVEVAICQLEAAGWVLVDAVNSALPSTPAVPAAPATSTAGSSTNNSSRGNSNPPSPPPRMDSSQQSQPPQPFRFGSSSSFSSARTLAADEDGAESSSAPFYSPFQPGGLSMADDFYSGAGPSSSYGPRFRMLDFFITHLDKQIHLKVPDNEDVKTLKLLIQNETGFPPCQQLLSSFGANGSNGFSFLAGASERRRLSDLNLPKENFLRLETPTRPETNGAQATEGDPPVGDFRLIVKNETKNDTTYTLNFRPTQTVLKIKLDVATLTDIPVSKQVWTGWPAEVSDELSLAQLGIPQEHRLSVDRAPPSRQRSMPLLDTDAMDESGSAASSSASSSQQRRNQQLTPPATAASSSTPPAVTLDSDEDFEDASSEVIMDDDDFFHSGSTSGPSGSSGLGVRRVQPLIPDDYGDEVMAGIKFSEEFGNRYGVPHPAFFPGSLSDAIKESCMTSSARERKMLAIYLHHDHSVLANVFCTQALCADSVIAFLNENFVTFGWDLTYQSNKARAIKMITDHFGSVAAARIKHLEIEQLPLLVLVYKLRGTVEIFQLIHGNVTLDELMSQLLSAHDTYVAQLSVEVREEEEREARNAVKREQDLAFEMAQHADREKEFQREREEAEKMEQDRLDAALKASEDERKLREEAEKERKRKQIEKRLPAEPPESVKHAKIRFRVTGGDKNLERRFLPNDKLQIVFDYLTVEGFPIEEHKVLSSWPRRDLTTLDPKQTLTELKLYPQETLTLEEK